MPFGNQSDRSDRSDRSNQSDRSYWRDGVDLDLLNRWRAKVRQQYDGAAVRAARTAAEHLRGMEGKLPVQRVVSEMAAYEEVAVEEVLAYLAALGMGVLVALSASQEENKC